MKKAIGTLFTMHIEDYIVESNYSTTKREAIGMIYLDLTKYRK